MARRGSQHNLGSRTNGKKKRLLYLKWDDAAFWDRRCRMHAAKPSRQVRPNSGIRVRSRNWPMGCARSESRSKFE